MTGGRTCISSSGSCVASVGRGACPAAAGPAARAAASAREAGGRSSDRAEITSRSYAVPGSERTPVHTVLLHDPPVHRFQPGVHVLVGLEDEAGLAMFERRPRRGFEVFDIEQGGDAGVLVLGLDPE